MNVGRPLSPLRWLAALAVCGCGTPAGDSYPLDAGSVVDAPPEKPVCLVDPPTDELPAPLPPLPVTPKVLWSKPLGFDVHPQSPVFAVGDKVVVASRQGLRFYSREGTPTRSYYFRGIGLANRVPIVVGPDDRVYVGADTLHRIDPDGTDVPYEIELGPNIVRGREGGAWISKLALGPDGVLHVLGSDGSLHGFAHNGKEIYKRQIYVNDMVYEPRVYGMGATLMISSKLYRASDGTYLGYSYVGQDKWPIYPGTQGERILANSTTETSQFVVIDACGNRLNSAPSPGPAGLPALTALSGAIIWSAFPTSTTKSIIRTDRHGVEEKRREPYDVLPRVVGADGLIYSIGKRGDQSVVVALSEDLEEKWVVELPAHPAYVSSGLGKDGVLYLAEGVTHTLTAVQTTSPGLAAVPNPLATAGVAQNLTNWVGSK